jgi:hypothetical protein
MGNQSSDSVDWCANRIDRFPFAGYAVPPFDAVDRQRSIPLWGILLPVFLRTHSRGRYGGTVGSLDSGSDPASMG